MKRTGSSRWVCMALATAGMVGALSGCVPLVVGGGMATAALSAADRRTTGAQVEDQGIELRASDRIRQSPLGDQVRVNTTSYNRKVLISGEARTEKDKQEVERLVREVNNVEGVFNELEMLPFTSSLTQRGKDSIITTQVKASLLDSKDLQASAIKVVTENKVVYLLGIVTERESKRAAEVARGINDVRKVVRLFEITTEDALANYMPGTAPVTRDPATEN